MPPRLHRTLSRWDGIAVAVGSVIGVGIFRVTGLVYRGAGSTAGALAVWVVLGALALVPVHAAAHGAAVAAPAPALPLIAGLAGAWYAYIGWQDGALLAEELREPRRDLPFVLVGAVAVVVAAYVTVNAAILYA